MTALKTKADANYRPVDTAGESCHTCRYRIPADNASDYSTCSLVRGTVDPQHVCDLFAPLTGARMTEPLEYTVAAYESEVRDKYSADDMKDLAKKGQAMKNANGDPSYPVADEEDIKKAVKAVGRGGADHDAIRKHIMAGAKKLNLMSLIPDNWNADGSLAQSNAADDRESRDDDAPPCPTCDGTGKIRAGKVTCPDCDGTGKTTPEKKNASRGYEWRKAKAEAIRAAKGHLERRSFPTTQFEMREDTGSNTLRFSGYASMTATPYEVGHYTETIERGAFKRTLGQEPDVQLLLNHGDGGSGMPLARTGVNMSLAEDERGLKVDADLDPEDPDVILLARKLKNGLVDQMSFAFQATDQDWNDDYTQRSIKSVSIHRGDVSVVNQGASSSTTAALRSADTLQFLERVGPGIIDAFEEWRDYTLVPLDERAGKTLSSASMEVLSKVLSLVQTADDATDQAAPLLSDFMGVANPNAANNHNADGSPKKGAGSNQNPGNGSGASDAPAASTSTDGSSRSLARRTQDERERILRLRKAG